MGIVKIFSRLSAHREEDKEEQPQRCTLFEDFRTVFDSSSEEEPHYRAASRLVANHNYEDGIEAYEMIMKKFPSSRSYCEVKVGTIHLLCEAYQEAFNNFMASKVHGADDVESERHIWDACTGILSKSVSNRVKDETMDLYLKLFPQGVHKQEAEQLLQQH